ncbi:MAG: hypothetical protein RBT63_07445 [Bdellovibrionales bacterium]|jgi:hypothetical protein|nr:hypothetical protein [Bdellovibrionales bacterium]
MFSPAGGLIYHFKAFRQWFRRRIGREDHWHRTRELASGHLREFVRDARADVLVLVGPSGGYLLSSDTLERMKLRRLIVVEPDFLAHLIFRWRMRRRKVETLFLKTKRLLPFFDPDGDALDLFLQSLKASERGSVAVVFWGVLGQVKLLEQSWRQSENEGRRRLLKALDGVSFASLHDGLSWRAHEAEGFSITPYTGNRADVLARELAAIEEREPKAIVIDHDMGWLEEELVIEAFPWVLSSRQIHSLHWVRRLNTVP